jgi:hypothetical protein
VSGAGLSKSLILKGIQCPKALYLAKYPPDFEFPPKPELEARYRAGTEVGLLAQRLFPGGTEVPYEGLSVVEQVARTRKLIEDGADVVYEASFEFEGIFVKADILVRNGAAWEIHEVKMATGVKEVNRDDAAIQYYVLSGCGLQVARAFIVHIDNSYVRQGEIELNRLFTSEDVTEAVLARQEQMPQLVSALRATLQGEGEPAIDIGPQCTDPYECDFIPYCWRYVPEDSVFSLRGRGIDKFAFYRQGLVHLADLPLEKLNGGQRFQAEATLQRRDFLDPDGIREFLGELWYPLFHLDFETFDTPIPPFDGTRPYQKIPFQYSLHIESQEGSEPQHFDYLAEPGRDPRRKLAEKLLAEIPEEGCVLTYNQAFEKGVLRDLAGRFPDLAEGLEKRIANIRDLMRPFKQRQIYRWPMRGSYSIKAVLPALVPDLSYEGLDVADGQMAMLAYDELGRTNDPARADRIRRALLEYCRLDTLAMVKILAEVRRLAAKG